MTTQGKRHGDQDQPVLYNRLFVRRAERGLSRQQQTEALIGVLRATAQGYPPTSIHLGDTLAKAG